MKNNFSGVIRLFSIAFMLIYGFNISYAQTTRYVSPSGDDTDNDCSVAITPCASIQAAVNSSSEGDSISVAAGTYTAFSVGFGGPENLIIQADGEVLIDYDPPTLTTRIVDLRADSITFRGFSINGGGKGVAISVNGQGSIISDNTIENVLTGIQTTTHYVEGGSTISGNTISESAYGISLQNNSNVVTGNEISVSEEGLGIGSSENTFSGNTLSSTDGGVLVQTYSNEDYEALPGSDANILNLLTNNTFTSAVYITDESGVVEHTIFGSIQDAVTSASSGDSVIVHTGAYSEEITISKSKIILNGKNGAKINIGKNETALTISGDSVTVKNLEIAGPYTMSYISVDWDAQPNVIGITVSGSASEVLIDGNTIKGVRSGVSFLSGSSGTASSNLIDNTKGAFLIRTDDAELVDNSYGEYGNEWDIVLFAVSDGAYTTSPLSSVEAYSRDILQLSAENGGMKILDRRYGTNGLLDIADNIGNRTHIYVDAASTYTASDDFELGNGLGNERQPLSSIQDGINGVVHGGTIKISAGTYGEDLHINKKGLQIIGAGIDETVVDHSGESGINNAGVYISADKVLLKGLTVTGDSTASTPRYGLKIGTNSSTTDSVTLKQVKVTKSYRTGIDVARAKDLVLDSVQAINNGGAGFFLNNTQGALISNITTSGNPWTGVSLATRDDWEGTTTGIVFSGENSFSENEGDNGSIQLEMTTTKPISWSTDEDDEKDVTLQSSDVSYVLSGPTTNTFDPGGGAPVSTYAPYFRFFKTLNQAKKAALGNPDHINPTDRYIRDADNSDGTSGTSFYVYADDENKMSIQAAISTATQGNRITVSNGTYPETSIDIDTEDVTLDFSEGVGGVDSLTLSAGIKSFTLIGDDSARVITGNNQDNKISISGGNNTLVGGEGEDTLILAGKRQEYDITEDKGLFTISDLREGTPNGENTATEFQIASFDNISISLSFGVPETYPGASLEFTSSSSEVSIVHDDTFQLEDSLSIEFWFYTSGFTTENQTIIAKGDDSWSIHRNGLSNSLSFTSHSGGVAHTLMGSTELNNNNWHHIAAVFDGSKKYLYIDGILDTSATASIFDTNSDDITIGGWTGFFDELRIWSSAISLRQLRINMYQQLLGTEEHLVGYWKLDEGTGSLAADFTSHNNDASIGILSGVRWSSKKLPVGTFITGDEGWRIITSPADGVSYRELLKNIWTQGFTGAYTESGDSNVYTYTEGDGDTDASERGFHSISDLDDEPGEGTAFIVYVYEDNDPSAAGTQVGFPKIIRSDSTQRSGEITIPLSLTKSGDSGSYNAANDGWNLIGNPYGSAIDWDAPKGWNRTGLDDSFYIWSDSANNGTGSYLSWNGITGTLENGKIAPLQGFWVKANNTESPTLTLNDSTRSGSAVFLKKRTYPEIRFSLQGNGMSNNAIVMFNEEASLEKDNLDTYKLASNNENWLAVFTSVSAGPGMDIQALPIDFGNELELGLGVGGSDLNGSFTLRWKHQAIPEGWRILLHDVETGKSLDLREEQMYEFDLNVAAPKVSPLHVLDEAMRLLSPGLVPVKSKTKGNRFKLVIMKGTSIGNENGGDIPDKLKLDQNYPNPFNPSTVISYQLPVNSEVELKVFDVLGREVAALVDGRKEAGYHQVTFNAENLASGMYIYRLRTGSTVITKKLTLIK